MRIGILSSDLVKSKKLFDLPIELQKIIYASYNKFGENNTYLLNPLNFQINFVDGKCVVEYLFNGKDIFNKLDVILIRRTRGFAKEIYDLIRVFKYMDKKPLILDPIESFNDPLSKISSYLIRLSHNIKQPNTAILWKNTDMTNIDFNPPYIIKPINGYRGHCVREIHSIDEIKPYIKKCLKESDENEIGNGFLVQEKINIKNEYRVLVLNGKSLGCVKKISNKIAKNADQGAYFEKVENNVVEKLAKKVAKIQKLFFAGVDVIEAENGEFYVLECNRNPQFRAFEEAYLRAGCSIIDVAKIVIDEVYQLAMKHKKLTFYNFEIKNYDVFISYMIEDFVFAIDLKETISNYGLDVWFDDSKVKLTDDGVEKSLLSLENSKIVLTLFSQTIFNNYDKSRTFYKELEKVLELEKKLGQKISIPILLQSINIDKLKQLNPLFKKYFENRRPLFFNNKDEIVKKILSEILYLYKEGKHNV